MKWKNRLTNYNFWISITSAVLLILQAFHINFDIAYINEIATAVLGLLVVIGIINDPTKSVSVPKNDEKLNGANAEILQVETEQIKNAEMQNNQEEDKVEQTIPINPENEVGVNSHEIDFKAIINFISSEVKNALSNIESVSKQNIKTDEEKEQVEEKPSNDIVKIGIEENKEEVISYNIVN